ncbi:MAG: diguanylate cyclase [Gammaproteobacteria bacterium]|nr:diguanylate cyclase [Gammaproteobacteria bacterium]
MSKLQKSRSTILPAMRISLALTMLTVCIILSAEMFGFTPQEHQYQLNTRTKISESLALQLSVLIPDQNIKQIQKLIRLIVKRNSEILSAGIRLTSGSLVFRSADHEKLWGGYIGDTSTSTHVYIPILQNGKSWGNVELRYEEFDTDSYFGFFHSSIFKLVSFIFLIGFFVYLVFILRTLRQLDPSSIIPGRVNAAFDTLAEGVLIIDDDEHILLANKAFCDKVDLSAESLIGLKASELQWKTPEKNKSSKTFPWRAVIDTGNGTVGIPLSYQKSRKEEIKFAINAAPILDNDNKSQGVLITLDDISELEQRNTDLKKTVTHLQKSQFQVQQQNKELNYLATRDPLTECLNRRAFSDQFATLFEKALSDGSDLACVMVDLDHFKAVNDNFGHDVGDEVIKMLAEILKSNTRSNDLVARYGGEEFCLVLPGMSDEVAIKTAERIRIRIKDESTSRFENGPRVTASLGISAIADSPTSPENLNKLADEALYVAKESGRNRVTRWSPDSQKTGNENENSAAEQTHLEPAESVDQLKDRINQLEEIASDMSAQLEYNQIYDELTGLPNQFLFYDRVNQAIQRGYRHDQIAAVLIIDIEMFSQINTSLGRAIGDRLLQKFSEHLAKIFRKSDGMTRLTLSRLAGDEFAVLLTDISDQDQVTWAVKRLLDSTEQPIEVDHHKIHLNTQVGISLYPTDANNVDEMLNHAMTAKKFCKKQALQTSYLFFDQHMQENSIRHLQMEKELREAIDQRQWVLLFQPKLDIINNRIIGAEALIRWQHPVRGLLSPYEFIEFAERHKLIVPIGDWVIEQACKQIKRLISAGNSDCKIAINLSPIQLMQNSIVEKICNELKKLDIPPRLFEIEITETALIDNLGTASEILKRLNVRGIPIAIDDFGTGYSSLNYLKSLPLNCLKIDRSFIKDICVDNNDRQIVKTLISMAHSLNLIVVAEGVEEHQQLELLNEFKCDEIQGYLLSKPITADELVEFIKQQDLSSTSREKVLRLHS